MKILYITGEVVPSNMGGSVHCFEVSRNLVKLGNEIFVVSQIDKNQKDYEEIEGIKIIRCNLKFFNKAMPILGIKTIYNNFKKVKIDLIMERFYCTGGSGIIFSKIKKIPLVLEVNNPHHEEVIYKYNLRNNFLVKILRYWSNYQFRNSSNILTPLKDIIPEKFQDRVMEISWGANIDIFNQELRNTPESLQIMKKYNLVNKIIIVYSGTFRKWQGVLDIPEIVKYVINKNKNIKFLLVGNGDYKKEVEEKIKADKLQEYCVFTGEQPYKLVPYFLSISHIGLAPFNIKGDYCLEKFGFYYSPLKIFEYMASGLPVITTDYYPLNEIVKNDERGKIIKSGNIKGFADTILELSEDKDLRNRFGTNAISYVLQNYSWKSHTEKLNKIFQQIVNK